VSDLIYRQSAINAIENTDCELLAEEWDELTNAIKQVPSTEPLTEVDYIELRDRFGEYVEFVVRDMITGKGERWR
jgi:hypothetical protein